MKSRDGKEDGKEDDKIVIGEREGVNIIFEKYKGMGYQMMKR